MKARHFSSMVILFGLFVSNSAFSAEYELRRISSTAPGNYVTLGVYTDRTKCEKDRKEVEKREPKSRGSVGCMKVKD